MFAFVVPQSLTGVAARKGGGVGVDIRIGGGVLAEVRIGGGALADLVSKPLVGV